MASGRQLAEENYQRFQAWVNSRKDEEFKQYVYRGQLSRKDIAKECEFSASVLRQNPRIKADLHKLENELRKKEILPQIIDKTKIMPSEELLGHSSANLKRLQRLELENATLRAENEKLKEYMKGYNMIDEFLSETMRMPR